MSAALTGNHLYHLIKQYEYASACAERDYYQLTLCCIHNEDRFSLLRRLFASEWYPAQFVSELYARVVLYRSERPVVQLFFRDGKNRNCTFEELGDYLLAKDSLIEISEEHPLETVLIGLPIENLPARVNIVLPAPLSATSNDTAFTNDMLSADLSMICIPPLLALTNPSDAGSDGKRGRIWQLRKLHSLLRRSFYSNYLFAVPDAESKQKQSIRDNLQPLTSPYPPFDESIFVFAGGLRRPDERAMERLMQEMSARTQQFFSRLRVSRRCALLDGMAGRNRQLIERKRQMAEMLERTNHSRQDRISSAERVSRELYRTFTERVEFFAVKEKGLANLAASCRLKLQNGMRLHDMQSIRVDVYTALYPDIAAYLQEINRILCAQNDYGKVRAAVSVVKWNVANIFEGVRQVEYRTQKFSFQKRGNGFRRRMYALLSSSITDTLMHNLKKEQERFMSALKSALDQYASGFRGSIPLIGTEDITESIHGLTVQQQSLEEKMNALKASKR
ncbi:hypothetical protein [Candidatus Soleaferrea massiliensis]|uniref:hypothetical protein n=1 Tax=Candidatus Soleaferrea massiliensis TaxID=1470354 RepID=UPI00058C3E3F|nr:hypothetical protein [Candidatus Soleaferrea massiliensis]